MKLSTFSIVARDPETGMLGVAGGTNWFGYGRWVPHIEAGVGAIATQAETNVWYGPNGLEDLRKGKSAQETLNDLLQRDPDEKGAYQLLVIDGKGNTACHTGSRCHDFAGFIIEENVGVAGNTLVDEETLKAVIAFYKTSSLPFGMRLIKALQEGQKAGGDIRGMKSAALKVTKGENTGKYWNDTLYDLRIDESKDPLKALEDLYVVAYAYQYIDKAESSTPDEAIVNYRKALELDPDNPEIMFWLARSYRDIGDLAKSEEYKNKLKNFPGRWEEYWQRIDKAQSQ